MAWLMLVGAGLFEVGFTTCLRYTDGFKNLGWNVAFFVCAAISFGLLENAAKTIPLGTAYAVWVGIGAVGTLIVGIALQEEAFSAIRVALILGLVACIIGLKLTAAH